MWCHHTSRPVNAFYRVPTGRITLLCSSPLFLCKDNKSHYYPPACPRCAGVASLGSVGWAGEGGVDLPPGRSAAQVPAGAASRAGTELMCWEEEHTERCHQGLYLSAQNKKNKQKASKSTVKTKEKASLHTYKVETNSVTSLLFSFAVLSKTIFSTWFFQLFSFSWMG